MSSFVGHGLAALTTYAATKPTKQPFASRQSSLLWLMWLVVIAWIPDIDHAIPALTLAQNDGMRITHAFASSLLLPAITLVVLRTVGLSTQRFRTCCWQVVASGLSHPLMDWFVGVIGLPLLWPFHTAILVAPIGLLPSAGTPHWQNYYFWFNLFIELGIIVPLMLILLRILPWHQKHLSSTATLLQAVILTAISLYFLHWSISLSR